MTDLRRKIEEVEAKLAESELLGQLATDAEARIYNRRLTDELREFVAKLRARLLKEQPKDAR